MSARSAKGKFLLRQCCLLCAGVSIVCRATAANPEVILWDYGPGTGLVMPPEGNSSVVVNYWNFQYFADAVTFPDATRVIGFNAFTGMSHLQLFSTWHVTFWQDAGGSPGNVLTQFNVYVDNQVEFLGDYPTTGGMTTDVYAIKLRFPEVILAPGVTYWVGAAGLNYDAGTYGVAGPGDGRMAFFSGGGFLYTYDLWGDQMFQLVGVPEPGVPALLALGATLLFGAVRSGRSNVRGRTPRAGRAPAP
jgi:hypothetical protein